MGLKVMPGMDTTAIRITREICYSVAIRADRSLSERFCSVRLIGKPRNVPPGKSHRLYMTLVLEFSVNLREFHSGAIRLGG